MKTIKIATEFSDTPLGRFPDDGDYSGTRFRDELLVPALQTEGKVRVEIDGVEGYGSSFLEEAFGGLVRRSGFSAEELAQRLDVQFKDEEFRIYRDLIWRYIQEAKPDRG